jgi:hypothetical protein
VGKRARVAERRWGIEDDLVLVEPEETAPVDSEGVSQEEAEVVAVPEEGEEAEAEADAAEESDGESPEDSEEST